MTIETFLYNTVTSTLEALLLLLIPAAFAMVAGIVILEKEFFKDIKRVLPQSVLNIKLLIFNSLFVVPAIALITQALYYLTQGYNLSFVNPESWDALPLFITLILAIIVGDFAGYWRHRLEHMPIFWPGHAVHHSDDEMTWLTLERFHPVGRLITFFLDNAALLALSFPPEAIFANNFVRHYYGFVIHADLPWTYGPLSKVFVSPAMHRWHHTKNRHFFNKNYATVFSLWDQMFKTYSVPGPCTEPLGVSDDIPITLRGQLGYMFKPKAYSRIIEGRSGLFSWKKPKRKRTPSNDLNKNKTPLP